MWCWNPPWSPEQGHTRKNCDKTLEEELTFNIEIIGEVNKENEATNESIRSRNEEETSRYDIEETQDSNTEIDINDIILKYKIYKKI